MILIYNIFIFLFQLSIRIAALSNGKAKQWIDGRKNVWGKLKEKVSKNDLIIWIHASSAGEFEQAKPVIEKLKINYPAYKILVSFFSPSGYHIAQTYALADYIIYLPVDTARNAKRFIKLVNPQLVVFIKYDFWYHYLNTVHKLKIPLLLVSAVFRQKQAFFKWYGNFYKKMLLYFNHVFVQDQESLNLLQKKGISHSGLNGDTRFDRVSEIAENFTEIQFIKEFIGQDEVLIAGSTWPDDERLLKETLATLPKIKLILAPHEINTQHIKQIQREFPDAVLYSDLNGISSAINKRVLVIDNVGMLSRLYYYATIAYIGGGFTKDGIHNCLEAAAYSKPVTFGTNYSKYREAIELIENGGAFSITTAGEFSGLIQRLLSDSQVYGEACDAARLYIKNHRGATRKIIDYIQEKRLLTS